MFQTSLFLFMLGFSFNVMALNPGDMAPDFSLSGHDGKTWSLKDLKGKKVVLEWYNQGCPFVRKHYDSKNMQKLQETYKSDVVWLVISTSAAGKQGHIASIEDAKAIYTQEGMQANALLLDGKDGSVGKLYGAVTTPHMYILSEEGKLLYEGAIDDHASADAADIPKSVNYVDKALKELKGAGKVSTQKTKPYGCSVKY